MAAAGWTLAVTALVLQAVSGVPVWLGDLLFIVVDAVVAAVYSTVAAVILRRRPHVVGWLTALAGIGAGLAALGGAWRSLVGAYPGLPELATLQAAYGVAWIPGTVGLFVLVPWFVRDTPLTPWAWCGVAGGVVAIAAFLFARPDDPRAAIVGVTVMGLVTAAATWWRHQHGPPDERRGLGLLAAGTAIMALSFLPLLATWAAPDAVVVLPLVHLACQALYPTAILVSVLRNRLWGIDLALSRATIAAMLTLGLVVVYAALVAAATALVGNRPAAQVVAAIGVALAVHPLRSWLQGRVRTLVHGDAHDAGHVALRLGQHLSTASTSRELLTGLSAAIREALRLESVLLESAPAGVGHAGPGEPVAGTGWAPSGDRSLTLPVTHAGVAVGRVTVTPRAGERLDRRSRDALEQLGPVVAVGLALAQGARDLELAREATTRARLAERQVIRRELHDGMGPWLSGLRLGLHAARTTLTTDPRAAAEVLTALQGEVEQRVEDVRALSRSLLPPVLDELGLDAALRELADRHAQSGFTLDVRCAPCPGLDARVAAAAYAIASEAALNAVRHAGTDTCRVTVEARSPDPGAPRAGTGWLVVTCDDAGSGIDPGATTGVGTRSMRERAHELGGTLEISPLEPGTRVRATLPLRRAVETDRAADHTPDDLTPDGRTLTEDVA